MYETFAMIKSGSKFSFGDMRRLVFHIAATGTANVDCEEESVRLTDGESSLKIHWSDAPHVVVESDEIADRFHVPSRGCTARFEMAGNDPDLNLFNDYLLINERLQETGKFVLFDAQRGKLLFEAP